MTSPPRSPIVAILAGVGLVLAAAMFAAAFLLIPVDIRYLGSLGLGGTVLATISAAGLIHDARQRSLRRKSSADGSFELRVNAGPAFVAHLADVAAQVLGRPIPLRAGRGARLRATPGVLEVEVVAGGSAEFPTSAIRDLATFSFPPPPDSPMGTLPVTGVAVGFRSPQGGELELRIPIVDRSGRRFPAEDLEVAVSELRAVLTGGAATAS